MSDWRYVLHLRRRADERALRRRLARLFASVGDGAAPEPDDPIELASERVCVHSGRLLDRRRRVRRPPTW
jgi:hypothetical protein